MCSCLMTYVGYVIYYNLVGVLGVRLGLCDICGWRSNMSFVPSSSDLTPSELREEFERFCIEQLRDEQLLYGDLTAAEYHSMLAYVDDTCATLSGVLPYCSVCGCCVDGCNKRGR
jgi:hypothetical protein